jgi:chromosome segregation protein
MQGRYASLEALQKAALGEGDGAVSRWLESHSLQQSARLAQRLDVESGWERAVETVLGSYLQAVCVDSIDDAVRSLSGLGEGALMLMETGGTGAAADAGRLTAKVRQAPAGVSVLLSRVFAADSLADALAVRSRLADDESVVTRDGIWLGRHWVRVNRGGDAEAGVLQREQDMRSLRRRIRDEEGLAEQAGGQLAQLRNETRELEQRRGALREASVQRNRQAAETAAAVENAAARLSEAEERRVANERSLRELDEERAAAQTKITASRQAIEASAARIAAVASDRERLERQRIELREELDRVRTQAAEDRAAARDIAIRFESRRSSQESARQSLARMERQLEQFREREQALNAQMAQADEPIAEQQAALAERLEERVEVERSLGEARHRVENTEAQLREHELARGEHEESVDAARTALDDVRMAGQETRVRRETLTEQFNETGFELATIRAEMPEDAGAEAWSEKLENLQAKIERLGPINLAAIEEFKEQAERKDYLDSQLTDLRSALDTLENAIRKIDRETRTRFKETYDRVNTGFQTLFPRLFGGGHAYLELTGDDLLAAGVTVMARPPGKRNSTIHLLSGGEKALTAVALVFAIFELNPAPFCMLDEVDAPLDDANVARFCDIVKSMSETVQFVFISHNKVTMEMARQLMGVTMYEPGVSRLVAVDLDEAVKMAAS